MPLTTIYGGGTRVIGDVSTGLFPQPIHPDVMAYVAAQVANGYNPSRARVDALNNLVWAFIGNGIYEKCQIIYPFLGGTTANTHKWNLKNVADTDAAFRIAFTGTWVFADTGIAATPLNTANFGNVFYTPSVNATNNDAHMSIYIRNSFTGTGAPIGGRNGNQASSTAFQIFASTGLSITTLQAQNTNQGIAFGTAGAAGFYAGNRSSSVLSEAYYNGVKKGTSVAASASLATATGPIILGAVTNGLIIGRQFNTTSEMAFVSIGQSLTNIQQEMFYQIVQAYQTALGRQV